MVLVGAGCLFLGEGTLSGGIIGVGVPFILDGGLISEGLTGDQGLCKSID